MWTGSKRTIAAIKLLLEDLLRVLLGLLRGVGVLEVGLVASGNLSVSHIDGWGWLVG